MIKIYFFLLFLSPLVTEELSHLKELTCEMGASIYFVSLKNKEIWIEAKNPIKLKKNQNKRFQAKFEFKDRNIHLISKHPHGLAGKIELYINRYSLGASNNLSESGQCFIGFKEYSKQF